MLYRSEYPRHWSSRQLDIVRRIFLEHTQLCSSLLWHLFAFDSLLEFSCPSFASLGDDDKPLVRTREIRTQNKDRQFLGTLSRLVANEHPSPILDAGHWRARNKKKGTEVRTAELMSVFSSKIECAFLISTNFCFSIYSLKLISVLNAIGGVLITK